MIHFNARFHFNERFCLLFHNIKLKNGSYYFDRYILLMRPNAGQNNNNCVCESSVYETCLGLSIILLYFYS